jgi:3-oxoacyl-[acyl-carrier protein] reductase
MTTGVLAGQTALVTGASRGIGRAIAESLAAAGAKVIGTATTPAGAEAISGWLGAMATPGRGAVLDVADAASVEALLAGLEAAGEMPGILVNNAGITRDGLLMRMKPEDWDAVLLTDLTSVFRLSRGCIKHMVKARQGRIVNITSVVGAMGSAGQTNYAAAKAGVIGFTKSLAKEVGSRNITRAVDEGVRTAWMTGIPLGRLGAPEDVAAAVLYLASPSGGYLTGQTLHVNGGLYMP